MSQPAKPLPKPNTVGVASQGLATADKIDPPGQDPEIEVRHRALNDMVTMAEAALMAYIQTSDGARNSSEWQCNAIARKLSRLITVYALSDDRQTLRALAPEDLTEATFIDAGRKILFRDGRAPLENLSVTRTALKSAIEVLKSPLKP